MYALRNLTSCVFFIKCEILVRNISDPYWVRGNIKSIDTKFSHAVRNWYQFVKFTKCEIYGSTMLSFKHVVFIPPITHLSPSLPNSRRSVNSNVFERFKVRE